MIVYIDKSFSKDLKKIRDPKIKIAVAQTIESVQNCKSIRDLKIIEKLKGFRNYYRIKYKDYRYGLEIEDEKVSFVRFLHRKDIYNEFP